MPDRPDPIAALNVILDAADLAHGAIFGDHRRLATRGESDDRSRDLVRESAQVVLVELAGLLQIARGLAARWIDESVLDPETAERTLSQLDAELSHIAPDVRRLRARQ